MNVNLKQDIMYTKEKWIFVESNLSVVANGNNIAFTGIPRHVSEIRKEGESWLDMRNRTEPERKAIYEEQKANAKLISAASEMFEALKSAEAYLVANEDILAPLPTRNELDNIRAAMFKTGLFQNGD